MSMYHPAVLKANSAEALQRLERRLFKDVKRLIRYQQSGPAVLNDDYEKMIQARFDVLGEISRRV